MANTTNFGWETPDDTDLVKDGAAAMRTLGNAIDASLVDLKGGTTGQVLSKNTNTDMDFTWVTTDDANAIQNAIVDAKGDLIAASAADTPARLAVGNNGETLVADSSASPTGLRWQGSYAAGKNAIINGAFDFWQRGTSFDFASLENLPYTTDRWQFIYSSIGTATVNISRQTFTPGAAPVAGYEGTYFTRWTCTTVSTMSNPRIRQKVEDVRQFAGQTVTLSFWAKADSNRTLDLVVQQNFGSGGSATANALVTTYSATSSWQRFSYTFTMPSISGKTIGTNSFVDIQIYYPAANSATLDLWGVQLEAGSVATAFTRAAGTLAGELAACQRYYYRFTAGSAATAIFGTSTNPTSTQGNAWVQHPVTMRATPTSVDSASICVREYSGNRRTLSSIVLDTGFTNAHMALIYGTISSGAVGLPGQLTADNSTAGYIGFSAEL